MGGTDWDPIIFLFRYVLLKVVSLKGSIFNLKFILSSLGHSILRVYSESLLPWVGSEMWAAWLGNLSPFFIYELLKGVALQGVHFYLSNVVHISCLISSLVSIYLCGLLVSFVVFGEVEVALVPQQ